MGAHGLVVGIHLPSFTTLRRALFLRVLSRGRSVQRAAEIARVSKRWAYQLREQDAEWAAAWASAYQAGSEYAENALLSRGVDGVLRSKGIYYRGRRVAIERTIEYSDIAAMFVLKARDPERYREHQPAATGPQAVIVQVYMPANNRDPELAATSQAQPALIDARTVPAVPPLPSLTEPSAE
jgi:hypothetical protein